MTAGRCRLVDGKVGGIIVGLHYSKDIWKAMTSEQKAQVLSLCKEKSARRSVKATSTAGSETAPMDVFNQLATLTRAVQSRSILTQRANVGHQAVITAPPTWIWLPG